MNVVAVGSTTRLAVTAYTASHEPHAYLNGLHQRTDVSGAARWSSDDPTIATVSSTTITGRSPGTTNLSASYMGRAYQIPFNVVAPSASAEQFAGTWTGIAKRFCDDFVGNTRSCYVIDGQRYVASTELSMSLTNVGGVLDGSIDIGGGSFSHLVGRVGGGVNDKGELLVGGALRLAGDGHDLTIQLRDWRFARSGQQLIGAGASDSGFVNIYGVVWQRVTYPNITLSR